MQHLHDAFYLLFGGNVAGAHLNSLQMIGRATVIYVAGLVVVRVGKDRLLGRSTAFDIVLGFILGSMLSRAINGAAQLLETLVAAVVLVALHWVFAHFARQSDAVAWAVKGKHVVLVRSGVIEQRNLRAAEITRDDLEEELRLGAHIDDIRDVELACLERNGRISIVTRLGATS